MEALWNKTQLKRPPNASWRIPTEKFDKRAFLSAIDGAIKDLESQQALHSEAAVLSRLIYRMKCKFRSDKGLKNMEKTNRALLNYLSLDLEKEYRNLRNYVDTEGRLTILPSKQLVQCTLVRTQGFSKLMCRVEEVAQCSAMFFRHRIRLGHAWPVAVIAYAVVSRIWILSKHLIAKSCIWYNNLYQYLEKFKPVGTPWYPGKLDLPTDLKTWLSLSWIEEDLPSVPSEETLENTMFKLITPHSDTVDIDLSLEDTEESSTRKPQTSTSREDIGEIIDRESFMLACKKENTFVASKRKLENEDPMIEVEMSSLPDQPTIKKKRHTKMETTITLTEDSPNTEVADNLLANIITKADLVNLLREKSYPGLDKLQWKMIRKRGKQLVSQIDEDASERKQAKSLRKIIRTLQDWMNSP